MYVLIQFFYDLLDLERIFLNIFFFSYTYLSTLNQCTEVRFASFFSDGFITDIVVNPPERRLAKCTSVQCLISKLSGFEGLKNWCPWHNSILCHIQIGILVNSIHMCHLLFITTKIEHQSHERKVALK